MNEHDSGIQAAKIYTITFCFWNLFWCLCVDVLSLSLVGFLLISDMLNFHILKTTRKWRQTPTFFNFKHVR